MKHTEETKKKISETLRRRGAYNKWRKLVYLRDNYTCQECGLIAKPHSKKLDAHHIVPCREDESLMYEVSNGITLCKPCHNKTRNKENEFKDRYKQILKSKEFAVSTTAAKGLIVTLEFRLP